MMLYQVIVLKCFFGYPKTLKLHFWLSKILEPTNASSLIGTSNLQGLVLKGGVSDASAEHFSSLGDD